MAEPIRIAVMASGGGSNLESIVDACEAGRVDGRVVCVVSDRRGAGALERARKHGIEAIHVQVPKTGTTGWHDADRALVDVFNAREVNLVAMAGYMRIIGPELVRAYRHRIMNIHPALLPAFPGVDVQSDAVDYGVKIAGATVHFADEEYDTGPIIIQAAVPVMPGDTAEDLAHRILEQEHRIYPQAIQWFAEGRLKVDRRRVILLDAAEAVPTAQMVSPAIDGDF